MNITSALKMLIPGSKGSPEDVTMMREVDTLLDVYHANTLTEMAQAAELMPRNNKKSRKSELTALMREKYFTRERVQASLKQLNSRERAVLNRLQLRGNQVSLSNFERELLRAGVVTAAPVTIGKNYYYGAPYAQGYTGSPNNPKSTVFQDVIARLTYHGLVFSRTAANYTGAAFKLQFHPYNQIFIPLAVARHLPEPEPIPANQPDWQPGRVQHGDPNLLLRDMYLYWDFLRRNEVALLQNGGVGKRSLKAINVTLLEPDPLLEQAQREDETNRLALLRRLLEGLKLAQADPGRLRPTSDSTGIPPFWSRPQAEQLRTCLELWPKLNNLAELGSEANTYSPRYPLARQTLVDTLKTLPPNRWIEHEELLELIRSQNPDFLFQERTKIESYRGSWYYSSSGNNYYGDPKGIIKKFDELELKFIDRCLAPGFLYQLGLIEVGYSQADPPSGEGEQWFAFRLTPTGQTLLNPPAKSKTTPAAAPTDEGRVVVQPNFQIVALGPVPLATLAQLDLFADREQADRGAFQYRLSRDSVYRAQQLGLDAGEVMRLLAQITSMELPQNVRRSLEEWGSHHERIVFRTGVNLLQAASPALLEQLTSPETPTATLLARPLTPDVALTQNGQPKELIAALIAQGLLPAVSGAKPEAADKSVIVQADGLIQPIHAVPSLHLRGRLARLAEESHEGQWRLTPASVRRATGSRAKVISLLEELSKLHRGPLPDELAVQLKAWGNYYGNATVSTLTLIEFRDHTALEELRGRPEVGPYLTPFPAGNRALAAVPTDKVAELQEILARFGVKVQSVGE